MQLFVHIVTAWQEPEKLAHTSQSALLYAVMAKAMIQNETIPVHYRFAAGFNPH